MSTQDIIDVWETMSEQEKCTLIVALAGKSSDSDWSDYIRAVSTTHGSSDALRLYPAIRRRVEQVRIIMNSGLLSEMMLTPLDHEICALLDDRDRLVAALAAGATGCICGNKLK